MQKLMGSILLIIDLLNLSIPAVFLCSAVISSGIFDKFVMADFLLLALLFATIEPTWLRAGFDDFSPPAPVPNCF